LIVFANLAGLIGGLIIGDFGGPGELTGIVGSIVLVSILLFILSFITRKVVINTFEFFMFGNNFGAPTGIALLTALILVIFISFLQLVHIEMNSFLFFFLVFISLFLSFPIFRRFAKWYGKKKELMLEKGNVKTKRRVKIGK
jgi:hypothetical protein